MHEIGHNEWVIGFENMHCAQAHALHAAAPIVEGGHHVGGQHSAAVVFEEKRDKGIAVVTFLDTFGE
jgi:hypothetical protein